jgi:hypothetical protein
MEASWRPILVDIPSGLFVTNNSAPFGSWDRGRVRLNPQGAPLESLQLIVPFRNVGTGPAIIVAASLSIGDHKSIAPAKISAPIVPPSLDELVKIEFEIPVGKKEHGTLVDDLQKKAGRPPWLVVVAYNDQAGTNLWRTEAHIHPSDESDWFVRQIALFDKTGRRVVISAPKSE